MVAFSVSPKGLLPQDLPLPSLLECSFLYISYLFPRSSREAEVACLFWEVAPTSHTSTYIPGVLSVYRNWVGTWTCPLRLGLNQKLKLGLLAGRSSCIKGGLSINSSLGLAPPSSDRNAFLWEMGISL